MIHDSCDKLETLGLMAASISHTGDDDDMPVSAIALIAVAGVILIGSIAAICFICRRYRRYDRGSNLQEKLNQQLEIYETQEIKLEIEDGGSEYDKLDTPRLTEIHGETNIGVVNPAFISETADQEADVQPLDSIESNEPETADVSERDLNSSMSDASDGNCNVGVKDTRVLTSDPTLNASQSELGNPECGITNTDTASAGPQSTELESSEPEPDYSPQKVRFHEEVLVEDSDKDAPSAVESSDKECEPIYENGVEKSDNEIELPSNSLIVDEENETHTHDGLTVTPL